MKLGTSFQFEQMVLRSHYLASLDVECRHDEQDTLKVCFTGHADGNRPQLRPHAEELSRDTHSGQADQVDAPPGEGVGEGQVPPDAAQQVQ